MSSRVPKTLLEVAVAHAGLRRGARAAQFAIEWSVAVADVGELGQGESVHAALSAYAEWWDVSERTAYRRLADFRVAFPGEDTPAAIAEQLAPSYVPLVEHGRELQAARRRMSMGLAVAQTVGSASFAA